MTKKKQESHTFNSIRITVRIKRFVWIFFALAIIITLGIGYQTIVNTSITFTRSEFSLQSTFSTTISPNNETDELEGTFTTETFTYTYTETSLPESRIVSGKSSGIITVLNNYSQDQPLQATTRFLSTNGTLFRSTERIDVPAGGTATVTVVADEAGASNNIAANTKFTIPGLWLGLQDKIYGVNDDAFIGGTRSISIITPQDIVQAQVKAKEGIEIQAKKELLKETPGFETFVIQTDIISQHASANAGDESEELNYTIKARYITIVIPTEKLSELIYDKLSLKITEDESITKLLLSLTNITVDRINTDDEKLIVRIDATANAILTEAATVFQPIFLQNKTESEIQELAIEESGIKKVEIVFSPFWVKKTPSDPSRISIDIN